MAPHQPETRSGSMSQMGQTRRFILGRGMSVVPPIAEILSKSAQHQASAQHDARYLRRLFRMPSACLEPVIALKPRYGPTETNTTLESTSVGSKRLP